MTLVNRRSFLAMMSGLVAVRGDAGADDPASPILLGISSRGQAGTRRDQAPGHRAGAARLLPRISSLSGFVFDYRRFPWQRVQTMVRQGQLDAFCTVATAERQAYALFAPTPLTISGRDLLSLIDHNRLDIFAGDIISGRALVARLGLEDKIAVTPAPFLGEMINRFGLRKTFPAAAELIARIDQAIIALRHAPDFAMLAAPYQ